MEGWRLMIPGWALVGERGTRSCRNSGLVTVNMALLWYFVLLAG